MIAAALNFTPPMHPTYHELGFSDTAVLLMFLFSLFSFAMVSYFICMRVRIGNRRIVPSGSTTNSNSTAGVATPVEHETGLFQQWYTDQPCQRLFGVCLTTTVTPLGHRVLTDREHMLRALALLVRRYPVLTTTIRRRNRGGGGSSNASSVSSSDSASSPSDGGDNQDHHQAFMHLHMRTDLGDTPVNTADTAVTKDTCAGKDMHGRSCPLEYAPRVSDHCWQGVIQRLTHTDMDEEHGWLFRVAVLTSSVSAVDDDRADNAVARNPSCDQMHEHEQGQDHETVSVGTAVTTTPMDAHRVDMVLVLHHVIADGLSSTNLLAELLKLAAGVSADDTQEIVNTSGSGGGNELQPLLPPLPVLLPLIAIEPCPYTVLDSGVDLRPPLWTILKVIGVDFIPAVLRPRVKSFYQGPAVIKDDDATTATATTNRTNHDDNVSKTSRNDNCSNSNNNSSSSSSSRSNSDSSMMGHSHFSSIAFSPQQTLALRQTAKRHGVTLQGLLSSVLMRSASIIASLDSSENDCESIRLFYPVGHGVRKAAYVSTEAVGVFIASNEFSADISTLLAGSNGNDSSSHNDSSSSPLWSLAKQISEHARDNFRPSLDMLGMLDFLPRASLTPWFLKQGQICRQGRNSTVELSNLGANTAVDHVLRTCPAVQKLFLPPAMSSPTLYFCMGRNYLGPVFGCGAVTCGDVLTFTITSNVRQCGCHNVDGTTTGHFAATNHSTSASGGSNDSGDGSVVCCGCPYDGALYKITTLVHDALVKLSQEQH